MDFATLFRKGRWISPRDSNVRIRGLKWDQFQTAIAIPKKVGNAVRRNKARRQVREILRHLELTLFIRGRFVLILNKDFVKNEFAEKRRELREIFQNFMARQNRGVSH